MIKFLWERQAAPRKRRPAQWRAQLDDRQLVDLSMGKYHELLEAAKQAGILNYHGFHRLPDDEPGQAKWFGWRLDDNELTL